MNQRAQQLRQRVKRFAIAILKFVGGLPRDTETEHWLDVLLGTGSASGRELHELHAEVRELGAIFRASLATARANFERSRNARR